MCLHTDNRSGFFCPHTTTLLPARSLVRSHNATTFRVLLDVFHLDLYLDAAKARTMKEIKERSVRAVHEQRRDYVCPHCAAAFRRRGELAAAFAFGVAG